MKVMNVVEEFEVIDKKGEVGRSKLIVDGKR